MKFNGLRKARNKKEMNISELALSLGVDVFTIKGWEEGVGKISNEYLVSLSRILNVTTDMILFGEERQPLKMEGLTKEQRDLIFEMNDLMRGEKEEEINGYSR